MKLAGANTIAEASQAHANAAPALSAWVADVTSPRTQWRSFQDVRKRYATVDKVGDRYVFNIKSKKYRLIAQINFATGVVFVRWFGTHASYNKFRVEEV